MRLAITAAVWCALVITGCSAQAPPMVTVSVAGQTQELSPTQYCLDGEPQFYPDAERPPVLRVGLETRIVIQVPDEVADSGWQVQIFDEDLDEQLGQVAAGNERVLDEIDTSDPLPPAYFLVVVQDAGSDCEGLSGAWPIGFVRDG